MSPRVTGKSSSKITQPKPSRPRIRWMRRALGDDPGGSKHIFPAMIEDGSWVADFYYANEARSPKAYYIRGRGETAAEAVAVLYAAFAAWREREDHLELYGWEEAE